MRVWAIAAAVGAAAWAVAGGPAFLDVSTGSHEVAEGQRLDYVVARGDAVVTVSGGEVAGTINVPEAEHTRGVTGGVVATGGAQVILDGGLIRRAVIAAGRSNVWIGRRADVRDVYATGRASVTLESPHERELQDVKSDGAGVLIVRDGRFAGGLFAFADSSLFLTNGDVAESLYAFESSRVELLGGRVRADVGGFNASEVVIAGGYVDGGVVSYDDARVTLDGGSVFAVTPNSTEPFVMTSGEARKGVEAGTDFVASGGIINGVVWQDGHVRRFEVRRAFYDHDADPATPRAPIEFDSSGIARIESGDPRLNMTTLDSKLVAELHDVSVTWLDGSSTEFDYRAIVRDGAWSGRLEFVRSTIPEDLNQDGGIDVLDLSLFLGQFGSAGGSADFNGDGLVDVLDLVRFLQAWDNER